MIKQEYSLEVRTGLICICFTCAVWFLTRAEPEITAFFTIANAGFLFVAGQMYSRLKDRRDARRNRAHELFIEWHSRDVRAARIYVSRWVEVNGYKSPPSLSEMEKAAAAEFLIRYRGSVPTNPDTQPQLSEKAASIHFQGAPLVASIDDAEHMEFNFFSIYQFFERWTRLELNGDIDTEAARSYMGTYTKWYFRLFLTPWLAIAEEEHDKKVRESEDGEPETDGILVSLRNIDRLKVSEVDFPSLIRRLDNPPRSARRSAAGCEKRP